MRNIYLLVFFIFFVSCGSRETNKNIIHIQPDDSIKDIVEKAANVRPSKRQWEWQKMEMTAFIHFTVNTFTDMEWGHGDESPEIFNPTDFDADQMVKTCKDAGIKLIIPTAKHHDGFCLWPSQFTNHSVKSSLWENGEGDVLKEISEACKKYGIKFGFYLSPWDRHEQSYGTDDYNDYFINQLTELMTNYGKIYEVWFDGACGEGPNGKRQVYDWERYYAHIRKLAPDAVIAVMGPDVRWVGTESGYGRKTEWSVLPLNSLNKKNITENSQSDVNFIPGGDKTKEDLGSREKLKNAKSLVWYPSEVDVSIRPGWFFHEDENNMVKTPEKLVDIYYSSVGQNSLLLLNLPPSTKGQFHENDIKSLQGMRKILDNTFNENFMDNVKLSNINNYKVICDNKLETSWKSTKNDAVFVFGFEDEIEFDRFLIQEDIYNVGQRVENFTIFIKKNEKWVKISEGTTIGYKRLLRFDSVKTSEIKIEIDQSRGNPAITEIGLYKAPPIVKIIPEQASFAKELEVKLESSEPNCVIKYTDDGSEPNFNSRIYGEPLTITKNTIIKAFCYKNPNKVSISKSANFFKAKYGVKYLNSYSPKYSGGGNFGIIDSKLGSTNFKDGFWQGYEGNDFEVIIDLGKITNISNMSARFLQEYKSWIFLPKHVEYFTSINGKEFILLQKVNHKIDLNNEEKIIYEFVVNTDEFNARYLKIKAKNISNCPKGHPGENGNAWLFVDEIIVK